VNIFERYNVPKTSSPIELPIYRKGFDRLLAEMNLNEGCEVGVLTGKHAKKMLDCNPNLHLHLVDSYKYYKEMPKLNGDVARYLPEMRGRLKGYNCTEHIMFSMDAVCKFKNGSLDFVYIDSNHRFDFIMQDLIEWSKKVRIGGIVSGHDYIKESVTQAVNAYTKAHNIKYFITLRANRHPDSTGTYFWVKA